MFKSPIAWMCTAASLAVFAVTMIPGGQAQAVEGWNWWDAIYAQQNHDASCPANPATKTQWEYALGTADKPDYTELTVFFIAYPCGGTPAMFKEYRSWLNYEIHEVGSWDDGWAEEDFYQLRELVWELDEAPAGFWTDGPWQ